MVELQIFGDAPHWCRKNESQFLTILLKGLRLKHKYHRWRWCINHGRKHGLYRISARKNLKFYLKWRNSSTLHHTMKILAATEIIYWKKLSFWASLTLLISIYNFFWVWINWNTQFLCNYISFKVKLVVDKAVLLVKNLTNKCLTGKFMPTPGFFYKII